MKNVTVASQKNSLDSLFKKISGFSSDPELSSHWAKYLCVLVYGFIEISMREILFDYASNKSAPQVANFVKSRVRGVWNWNTEKVFETIGIFDSTMRTSVEDAIDQEYRDAFNSVVGNRHKITHGESVNVSFSRIQEYYGKVVKVVDTVEQKLNP
jgi:hypothetical protein